MHAVSAFPTPKVAHSQECTSVTKFNLKEAVKDKTSELSLVAPLAKLIFSIHKQPMVSSD